MADSVERAKLRVTVRAALTSAVRSFKEHRVDVPELTAQVLLGDVLRRDKAWLFSHSDDFISATEWDSFLDNVFARCDGVPTQYLRGFQEFYGLEFRVTPDVLIPRPETEHLVEVALRCIRPGDWVVDIGTGSGAIAVAVALHAPECVVAASDYSRSAVAVATENAVVLGAAVRFFVSDLDLAVAQESIDVLLSNPPYVPRKDIGGLQRELRREPSLALFGGEDGFDAYRRLVPGAARVLRPGGRLVMELGYNSRPFIEELLDGPEWVGVEFHQDLAGIDRVVSARKRT